ncbi:hypothetical protein GS501_04740 [Saccharibacter sp. 17.LH.SD]|uniref:hypothetical protein n=1 Tax=Saccharibacter sp. 17.LH.SD TaxID=2689393 RepID=UPI001370D972|nr:hypothetical protein [Saccharibacter sp. 17.LH.SD]MXV44353.1 hypothetical protein [Saccharibacter sp. 17.LH.SD]
MITKSPMVIQPMSDQYALEFGQFLLGIHPQSQMLCRQYKVVQGVKIYIDHIYGVMFDKSRNQYDKNLAEEFSNLAMIIDEESMPALMTFIDRQLYYDSSENKRLEAADIRRKID